MYRNTRFGELMKGLPHGTFQKITKDYQVDKHSKGFKGWDHLLAMVYGQLSGCQSLRELEASFNHQSAFHYHLGTRPVRRSTLSEANSKRSSEAFSAVCATLMAQAHRKLRKDVRDLLYLIDSSPIPLKGLGYDDWTASNCSNRTQGLKMHMMIEGNHHAPILTCITPPNINDVDIGKVINIESGATYVFDKGYCDYNWWYQMHEQRAIFITRFKKNAAIEVVSQREIPESDTITREDTIVRFKNRRPRGLRRNDYRETELRKVVIERPDKGTPLILATNDLERPAQEIAALYKQRWGIELFFKWLKQNLKIRRFLGRSENAVKIQIYTAVITYLLIHLYRQKNGIKQTMKLLTVTLRATLFQRTELEYVRERRRRKQHKELLDLQGCLL
jgi:IS4 transposase